MPDRGRSLVRLLWTVVALLVVGAGALWLSSRLTWSWERQATPLRGTEVVTHSGADTSSALIPLAVLAVAAIAAVLAIGGWPRRIVGVLVGLAGVASVVAGTTGLPDVFGAHPDGYPRSQIVFGHGLALLAGLLLVVASVLVVRHAAGLPRMGGGYRTPGAARRRRDPDAELWQELSEGRDPTVPE